MLTAEEIARVKSSFDMVFANTADITKMFYGRLFELAPECRPMFRGDTNMQKRDFIATLAVLVGSLDQMTGLLSSTDILGRNHVRYGVKPEHYPAVGEALMWSLAKGLGSQWTDDAEQAWRKVYDLIAQRMIAIASLEMSS
jgi:hemoglobin-like flavoprotein